MLVAAVGPESLTDWLMLILVWGIMLFIIISIFIAYMRIALIGLAIILPIWVYAFFEYYPNLIVKIFLGVLLLVIVVAIIVYAWKRRRRKYIDDDT